jgi:hypothetical protein
LMHPSRIRETHLALVSREDLEVHMLSPEAVVGVLEKVYYWSGGKTEKYLAISPLGCEEKDRRVEEIVAASYAFHQSLATTGEVQRDVHFVFTVLFSGCGDYWGLGSDGIPPVKVTKTAEKVQTYDKAQAREYAGAPPYARNR